MGSMTGRPGFADMVIATLADGGLRPASLVLQLTESSLIETGRDHLAWSS